MLLDPERPDRLHRQINNLQLRTVEYYYIANDDDDYVECRVYAGGNEYKSCLILEAADDQGSDKTVMEYWHHKDIDRVIWEYPHIGN